jgi:hypothetical protein
MIDQTLVAVGSWLLLAMGRPIAEVQDRIAPRSRAQAVETLTIYGRHGERTIVSRGQSELAQAIAFRKLSPARLDSVAKLKRELLLALSQPVDIRKPLLKGRPAMAPRKAKMQRLLVVLEAMSAGTEAEYHAIVSRLGVSMSRKAIKDGDGRPVVHTDYSLDGRIAVSRTTVIEELDLPKRGAGGPASEQVSVNQCEYTDDDGQHWSGECASQQQIDDAFAVLAATSADMEDMEADARSDVEYCQEVMDDCWATDSPLTLEVEGAEGANAEPTAACISNPLERCYAQSVALGLSMTGYFRQAFKLGALVTAIAPPAGAIFDTAFGLALIAGGAYLAGRALSDCLQDAM